MRLFAKQGLIVGGFRAKATLTPWLPIRIPGITAGRITDATDTNALLNA
jgi:hypothetical protein